MTRLLRLGAIALTLGLGSIGVEAATVWESSSESEEAQRWFTEGVQHQRAGRFQEAVRSYERSLRHDSKQPEVLSNLGFCYKNLERYEKAIRYYKEAIRLDPDLAEAHEYLGEAYLELGKLDLAQRQVTILRKLDPSEAEELARKLDDAREGRATIALPEH